VLVIVSLAVLVGMAAFSIDTATWMVKSHHDQVVADAAALAAANCLAHPSTTPTSMVINGSQTTVPACTPGSNYGADAKAVAIDYAAANGLAITSSEVHVNLGAGTVNVIAPSTSPGLFARLFGIDQATQSAASTASWRSELYNCTDPTSNQACGFLFADDSCSNASNGIQLSTSGTVSITGTIISNGNLSGATHGTVSDGTASYGPGCSDTVKSTGSSSPWTSPPTEASSTYQYPLDYAKDFPACGSVNDPCQSNGYPSFCTNDGSNITLTGSGNGDNPVTDNIYCASGTGTPSDPSTWNGSITVTLPSGSALYDTFVGASIQFTGESNASLSACGYTTAGYNSGDCTSSVPAPATPNYPLFYATGNSSSTPTSCSSATLCATLAGGDSLYGDMAALTGSAYINMVGTSSLTGFVEALNINAGLTGTVQGDGPVISGSGNYAAGSDSLIQ
jgi:hypothetical protein